MQRRYGLIGFFSLIGLIGFYSHNPIYFPFLAFALFFEYFFVKTDEMFITNMRKAASWAFYANLAVTTLVTCYFAFVENKADIALTKGVGFGFGIAIMIFSFVTVWFDWKDRRGVSND